VGGAATFYLVAPARCPQSTSASEDASHQHGFTTSQHFFAEDEASVDL